MSRIDELNRAVALLYETALFEESWSAALQQVATAFGAFGVGHFIAEGPAFEIRDFHGYGHDARSVQLYRDYYHALDPGIPLICRAVPGRWLPDELMLPRTTTSFREYLHDYATPNGIGSVAGGNVPIDSSQRTLLFTVQRRPGGEPFGELGSKMFSILTPHLSAVARMTERVRALSLQQSLAQVALDSLQAGLVVVDARHRVYLVNRAAGEMMGPKKGLRLVHDRVHCESPACEDRLRSLVVSACSEKRQGGGMLLQRQGSPHSLHVSVLPIPSAHFLAPLAAARLAIVVVADPESRIGDVGLFRSLFGLTVAESELLLALVSGMALQEYADHRTLGINTVRTHLRSVMNKCGCNTQAKLVAFARTLPQMR